MTDDGSSLMNTFSDDQNKPQDELFITSTSGGLFSLLDLKSNGTLSDEKDNPLRQSGGKVFDSLDIFKIDPKEEERRRIEEEKAKKRQRGKLSKQTMMKLKLLSGGKRKSNADKPPPATPPPNPTLFSQQNTISNGTGIEVSLTPVAKKDPLQIGNVDEPRGIAKLTMLMKGKSAEEENKRKMREDPEQKRLWSQMISPKAQPTQLVLPLSSSNLSTKPSMQYFQYPNMIRQTSTNRNMPQGRNQIDQEFFSSRNNSLNPISSGVKNSYIKQLKNRNTVVASTQLGSPPAALSQNFLSVPSGRGMSKSGSKVSFISPSKKSPDRSENNERATTTPKRRKGYIVNIDQHVDHKTFVLTPQDVSDLFQAKISDLHIKFFQTQYLRFAEHCENFCINRKLILQEQKLGINAARIISHILLRSEERDEVAKICLARNNIGDEGAKIIGEALCEVHSVVQLDLSSNAISSEGGAMLIELLKYNYSVIDLNLASSNEGLNRNTLGSAGVLPLRHTLKVNKFLSILNLAGNFIGDTGVSYLVEGLGHGTTQINKILSKLNLSLNAITGEGLSNLYSGLKKTALTHLILSKNPLKNNGAKYIGEMIGKGNEINLEYLDISECQVTHQGAGYIYQGIRRPQSIMELVLDRNKLTAKSLVELSQAIWLNNTIEKLSMVQCELYDDGCVYLFDGIERNCKLKTLDITSNKLRFNSAKRIAEVLQTKDLPLTELIVSSNFLGDKGGQLIAASLAQNRTLTKLDLHDNLLSDETARKLAAVLVRNPKLHSIDLTLNAFDQQLSGKIKSLARRNHLQAKADEVPSHVKTIVALSFKAAKFGDIYKAIDEKMQAKRELDEKYQQMDQRVGTYRRVSAERQSALKEARKEYQEDIDELDKEIEQLETVEARQYRAMEREGEEMQKRCNKEAKDVEMLREFVQDKRDQMRRVQFMQGEDVKKYQGQLMQQNTKQKIAEVSYKMILKEILQYRPPWPTDLVKIENEQPIDFSIPKPGMFGDLNFKTTISVMKEERAFLRLLEKSQKKNAKKNKKK